MRSAPASNVMARRCSGTGDEGYTFCPFPKTGAAMSASAPISAPVFLSHGRGRNAYRVPFPAPAGTEGITHYTLRGKVVCQRGAPLWNPPAFPSLSCDGQNVRHVGQSRKRPQRRRGILCPDTRRRWFATRSACRPRHGRGTGDERRERQSFSSSTYSMTSSTRHCSSLHRRSIVLVDTL